MHILLLHILLLLLLDLLLLLRPGNRLIHLVHININIVLEEDTWINLRCCRCCSICGEYCRKCHVKVAHVVIHIDVVHIQIIHIIHIDVVYVYIHIVHIIQIVQIVQIVDIRHGTSTIQSTRRRRRTVGNGPDHFIVHGHGRGRTIRSRHEGRE